MTDQMRKEFEAWAGPYGHDISRSEINPEDYRCQETEWAYDAWQAARRAEPAQAEPVLYQYRTRPTWDKHAPWMDWEECTSGAAADYRRVPVNGGWEYEVRELYTAPQPAAEPVAWIPVSERLPESGRIEFYSDDLRNPTDQVIGVYKDGQWLSAGYKFVNVTHWKPTTAAPQQEQK